MHAHCAPRIKPTWIARANACERMRDWPYARATRTRTCRHSRTHTSRMLNLSTCTRKSKRLQPCKRKHLLPCKHGARTLTRDHTRGLRGTCASAFLHAWLGACVQANVHRHIARVTRRASSKRTHHVAGARVMRAAAVPHAGAPVLLVHGLYIPAYIQAYRRTFMRAG